MRFMLARLNCYNHPFNLQRDNNAVTLGLDAVLTF